MATVQGGLISNEVAVKPSGCGFSDFGENPLIGAGLTSNAHSFLVPAGKTLYIKGVQCGGGGCAVFTLKVATITTGKTQSDFGDREPLIVFDDNEGLDPIAAGTLVEVEAENLDPNTGLAFWARVYGIII